MKLTLQLLLLLFANLIFSQEYREATIFFNDNSSVKGFGEINGNEIYFKVNQEDKPSKWSYDIAKGLLFSGYGFSEKYEYVLYEKNKKPKIFEVIEIGNVTLYKNAKLFYTSDPHYLGEPFPKNVSTFEHFSETFYVKRANEEYATDIVFSFKTRAKKYFSDCKEIIEKIDSGKFTKKNIQDMVFFYNEFCGDEDQ